MTRALDTSPRPTGSRRGLLRATALLPIVLGIAGGGAFLAFHHIAPHAFFVINESRSLPRGLYRLSDAPIVKGAIITITPPAAATAYLERLGAPPDVRLLKRVAAEGGDLVCRYEAGLEIDRVTLGVARHDRQGRLLPQWRDCRVLAPGELLVLGDSPDSFDSRYFGPVQRSEAKGPYVEAIRW